MFPMAASRCLEAPLGFRLVVAWPIPRLLLIRPGIPLACLVVALSSIHWANEPLSKLVWHRDQHTSR